MQCHQHSEVGAEYHLFTTVSTCFPPNWRLFSEKFYMTDIDSCVEKCIPTPDVRNVAPRVMCVSSQLGVCVFCYEHRGQLATNTWSSHGELFPRWWLSLYLLSPALWEISSCLKRSPLRWLCFPMLDLRGSSCWFDGAFVAAESRSSFGFPPAQPTGTDMKVLSGCFIQ